MDTISRTIPSGETVIFDKTNRDLYIIDKGHAGGDVTTEAAHKLVSSGKAQHYNREAVERLHHALAVVILLGAAK
jgi:hypothetical protein